MVRVDVVPGLLRGPASWAAKTRALSIFSPSICVEVLEGDASIPPELMARARAGIGSITESRIGGNCWTAPAASTGATILVVAPSSGDFSDSAWKRLIATLHTERGAEKVALLAPSVTSKRALAALAGLAESQNMILVEGPADVWPLTENISSLYTIDDELGFVGLLRGIEVRCFGSPFYSGWGLTIDDAATARRPVERNLEELFAAACLMATEYTDPYSKSASSFEDCCTTLAEWRRINDANREIAACMGMSFWKQRRMRDVLRSSEGSPRFCKTTEAAIAVARQRGGAIAVWAAREPADLAAAALEAGVAVVRIEDGFVRSVGLGANFTPAASVVLDRSGIYFDPAKPSDLEIILRQTQFDTKIVERSRRLIQTLVARGITKYNTGAEMPRIDIPAGRRKLFVPGQVEDDRSVATGGAGIYRNIDLLQRVRARNPDAFVIYKPHPDVDAGHRLGVVPDVEALRYADHIIRGVSTAAIIPAVDEIHTLTSLAGFEALIRGRKVVVYGQPFYAGWGLTTDLAPAERRQRRLTLEELIAGSLVLYPRYFDPVTRLPCGPEILIDRLSQPELWRPGALGLLRRIQGDLLRRYGNLRITKTSNVSTAHLDKRQKHVKPA